MAKRIAWVWLLTLALAPVAARAQQGGAPGTGIGSTNSAAVANDGGAGDPSLTDTGFSRNFLFLGADLSTQYDDNVRQSASDRVSDTAFVVSPVLALRRRGGRLAVALRYRPTLLFYRHEAAYNEQDHALAFDASLRATERWRFRLGTDLLKRSSLLESFSGPAAAPALGPSGRLNDSVLTPFASEFEDDSRAGASYALSLRSEVGFFTTYMVRSFGLPAGGAARLEGTEGRSAGLRYVYRASPRTTLGLDFADEEMAIGPRTRLGLDQPTVGLGLAVTPRLTVNVYGGPVYTRLRDTLVIAYGPEVTLVFPHNRNDWRWAAGGGLTLRAGASAFRANFAHRVSDGGGLLDAVTSEVAQASLSRRLARRWTIEWAAAWQRNASLPSALLQGTLDGEYGRILFRHPISEMVSAGFGYEFERQRSSGIEPLGANFDRNLVYFTLTYRFKNLPLGR